MRSAKEYRVGEVRLRAVRESTVVVAEKDVGCGEAAAKVLHALLDDSLVERVYVLLLNGRNKLIAVEQVSQGGLHGSSIAQRDVFRVAIVVGASAIILGHNHPSGDPTPSEEDKELTRGIVAAGKVVGIPLVDHVITSPNGKSVSMYSYGLLDAISKEKKW